MTKSQEHLDKCLICRTDLEAREYFNKWGSWSPFLITVSTCEGGNDE